MSASPELSLQEAIYGHLLASPDVQQKLGSPVRLYDDPPPSPQFPFASFGRHQTRPLDGDDNSLLEHTLSLHVWSSYNGKKEAQLALHAFRETLGAIPSTMTDHKLIGLRILFSDVLRAKNGRIFQAILRIRALTEQTT